jgi:predicted negative regulator of RcsB-dependent stress response
LTKGKKGNMLKYMNLIDKTRETEEITSIWLANMLVLVVVVVLGTVAVARYFSVV